MANEYVASGFEQTFLRDSLADQIRGCDSYPLAPLFIETFRGNQPVLEAGCGSGKWCGWLSGQGIQADGVDWSEELCRRAQSQIPNSRFRACDMENTPFPADSFGGVMALGSIEHSAHGPVPALREFYRLLRPGGVAIITVPFGGPIRRLSALVRGTILRLKTSALLRRLLGYHRLTDTSLAEAKRTTNPEWHPVFQPRNGVWHFYEYHFSKRHMRGFFAEVGFQIEREFAAFDTEGLIHNFGPIAGTYNHKIDDVELTGFGKLLRLLIPVSVMGHMLCYVVQKPRRL